MKIKLVCAAALVAALAGCGATQVTVTAPSASGAGYCTTTTPIDEDTVVRAQPYEAMVTAWNSFPETTLDAWNAAHNNGGFNSWRDINYPNWRTDDAPDSACRS